MPPQPQNLDDIDISDSLCLTLNKENFLVRDSIIRKNRIILFTTKANIQHLSRVLYWIIDGIFKTVPTIFCQLYTIHTPIGTVDNSRSIISRFIEFAEESNILLRPTTILTDFELTAINASHDEFPSSVHDSMEIDIPRTSNIVEAWHQHWENLVDRSHVGVYTIVTKFQKEQQQVEYQIETILHGTPCLKPKKDIIEREKRLDTIIYN
ncbi:10054_t:CDS:2 [Dentiscutata heterogama]|uniref:10054_t:CDS:1 n=1 Tax=Dentiscutata heterogama TaxID=1316150 RepID=A0ACA9LK69_9GLOM|nr:10054_t:CDS:2 [Dentiscutata heterogama]